MSSIKPNRCADSESAKTETHVNGQETEGDAVYLDPSSIVIKSEYERMYGQMHPAAYEALKESIRTEGQLNPITVNQDDVLIDGHMRLEIARELQRPVLVKKRYFKDRSEEKRFIHIYNLNRRQLTEFARIEAVVIDEPFIREEARKRRLSGLRQGIIPPLVPESTDGIEKGRTDQVCADWAGVSLVAYRKVRDILKADKIPEDTKLDLRSGKIVTKELLRMFSGRANNRVSSRPFQGESYILADDVRLIRGPFTDLNKTHFTNDSIKLILPSVDCSHNPKLTKDLAIFASRFLPKGGYLALYTKQNVVGTISNAVAKHAKDLELLYVVQSFYRGGQWINVEIPYFDSIVATFLIFWKRLDVPENEICPFGFNEPMLIDAQPAPDNSDSLITSQEASLHMLKHLIKALNIQAGIVCDPACGSGELGLETLRNGLKFIGIENDPEKFQSAKTAMNGRSRDVLEPASISSEEIEMPYDEVSQ